MMRWLIREGREIQCPKADEFIRDLLAVSERHRLSLSHEDTQGAFIVSDYDADKIEWLRGAMVESDMSKPLAPLVDTAEDVGA